jgi:xylulose-5-phosphate/fructose-6-phosphate phosphoketolase
MEVLMAKPAVSQLDVSQEPLSADELHKINAYWRASLYLCVGMIYLKENPLLKKPLKFEHIKKRLLGHWGSDPGQCLTWVHLNRMIKK